jgi:hypothetical protein
MVTIPLAPVEAARVTILMDNLTDPLLVPTEQVERTTWFDLFAKPWARGSAASLPTHSAPVKRSRSSPR